MKKVIAIGEIVFDIIIKDGKPLKAIPGGSMLNSAVSLARAGIPSWFCGHLGDDDIGQLILQKLSDNSVNTDSVLLHEGKRSILAIAMMDENGEAKYSFYKDEPDDEIALQFPHVNDGDIILFGSFFSLKQLYRKSLIDYLREAEKKDVIIIYDPNFRKPHLPDLHNVLPLIIENIQISNIVRASVEDLKLIFRKSPGYVFNKYMKSKQGVLIATDAGNPVILYSAEILLESAVEPIKDPRTIGAGDSFNAGFISSLYFYDIRSSTLDGLARHSWKKCIINGVLFASEVCLHNENYISEEFGSKIMKDWNCSW